MDKKIRINLFVVLLTAVCVLFCLSFVIMIKASNAQVSHGKLLIENKEQFVFADIKNGETGSCYDRGISLTSLDNKNSCIDYCTTHGPGREKGGEGLLNQGCRNYMDWGFNYGTTDIPYWINMDNINLVPQISDRAKILNDIRTQAEMWNYAVMYDGTGQIVNIYEVKSDMKPSTINGKNVIEVYQADFTGTSHSTAAGLFSSKDLTVALSCTSGKPDYNTDTVVHEFGHVLGLNDIDASNGVSSGVHKTLMGYNRFTTLSTLKDAIKYQDIQGIAVMTGRHVCKDNNFMRYIKVGSEYRHICFYCDRIDNRTSVISGSKAIESNSSCTHDYQPMVSCGERRWEKCTKCYNVLEIKGTSGTGNKITLLATGDITTYLYTLADYDRELDDKVDLLAPKKAGYVLDGYYDTRGKKYFEMQPAVNEQSIDLHNFSFYPCVEKVVPVPGVKWDYTTDVTLYARWKLLECNYTYQNVSNKGGLLSTSTVHLTNGKNTLYPISINNYKFKYFEYYGKQYTSNPAEIDVVLYCDYRGIIDEEKRGDHNYADGIFLKEITCEVKLKYDIITAIYEEESDDGKCLAEGSMITLADGSQVAVENLKGDEWLLVWNLHTGTYDTAPILFIDKDPLSVYKVINLAFSDGSVVKIIYEHGFWDYDLNKYVYLDENAENYIGHWFNKGDKKVQLTGVEIKEEYTTPYSPVTYEHLCYFVDGMLSMPGGIGGLFNIFDVDAETMRYDEAQMQLDIETYGLFSYEEFTQYLELPEEVFEAFNGQYLKVAIGKGLITMDELSALYERYAELLV